MARPKKKKGALKMVQGQRRNSKLSYLIHSNVGSPSIYVSLTFISKTFLTPSLSLARSNHYTLCVLEYCQFIIDESTLLIKLTK